MQVLIWATNMTINWSSHNSHWERGHMTKDPALDDSVMEYTNPAKWSTKMHAYPTRNHMPDI